MARRTSPHRTSDSGPGRLLASSSPGGAVSMPNADARPALGGDTNARVPEEGGGGGGRGRGPASAVEGGRGVSPSAFRPHSWKSEGPHAGGAPPPRPDLDEVDDGHPQREPAALREPVDTGGFRLTRDHG